MTNSERWTPVPIPEQVAAVEGFADTPEVPIWYWDTGGDGEAVVLCHPASQSSLGWPYQQPVFARAGYRVIAYCRRGHYKTQTGADGAPGTAIGDLAGLLDVLGVERCHLLGAAAGGITAVAFAIACEARVLSLTVAGSIVSPNEQDWRDLYARLGMQQEFKGVPSDYLELGPSYRASNPQGFARFTELEHLSKPQGRFNQPSGVDVTWAAMEALRVPTLLLTGEADLYAPPPLQELIAAHLHNPECVTLREVGHAAYWERPDLFNRTVLEFMARVRAG